MNNSPARPPIVISIARRIGSGKLGVRPFPLKDERKVIAFPVRAVQTRKAA